MSSREVPITQLIGKRVRDPSGRSLGRLEEVRAEIELHDHANEYVVTEFHIGAYGWLEALAGGRFARHLLKRFGLARTGYCIPWRLMDLSDPSHPRATRPAGELPGMEE